MNFIYTPAAVLRYLRGRSRDDEHHEVGHSPLGALSVFALLLEELSFRRYRAPGQLVRLLLVALLETFLLRPLQVWWRLVALVTWRGRPLSWQSVPRRGLRGLEAGGAG